ncbi:hypothetical protein [Streptomyces sp. NPDC002722]|uniref:hypothetical protein n=1 Tax=Streptomyces sp. NPDC002722 TaxID=3154425 RepID=UPI00332BFAF7
MEYFVVHGPGDVQGEPVRHGDEYTGFVVDCYAVDDDEGKFLYDSAFFSRPKGCDKSGLGARIGLFEALGPARFAGWAEGGEVYRDPWGLGFEYVYEAGEPMGRPVKVPYLRIMATEEGQTGNVYDTIYFNCVDESSPVSAIPGLDPGLTKINLPNGGEITPSTASSSRRMAARKRGSASTSRTSTTRLSCGACTRRLPETSARGRRGLARGTWRPRLCSPRGKTPSLSAHTRKPKQFARVARSAAGALCVSVRP